jgi:hypothetical protein
MGDLGYVVSTAGAEAFGRLLETPLRSVSGAGRWPNAAPTP